jgi:thiosulfate dehydrogenase [quinone] large subunit
MSGSRPGGLQQLALVLLRTVIGWHLAWEGFVKLWWPSWSRGGWPLPRWSAVGYLQTATGPLADYFRALGESGWMPVLDVLVAVGLLLTGLSLMLGLFTQTGAAAALMMLLLFYAAHIPTLGVIGPGAEGNYLFVNKNLVEAAAILVLLVFRTGRIAGLDILLAHRRRRRASEATAPAATTEATP